MGRVSAKDSAAQVLLLTAAGRSRTLQLRMVGIAGRVVGRHCTRWRHVFWRHHVGRVEMMVGRGILVSFANAAARQGLGILR